MTLELRPMGVKCNIQCQYCYQNPQRDAGNDGPDYDLDAMKAAAEGQGDFTIFGGEPLMIPEKDLEDLWAWGFKKSGKNGIQTNGTLLNDNHVRLFKKYNVYVGLSIDGPGPLNDVRWQTNLERTREATAKTERAIERLCEEKVPMGLIVTLHRNNATADKLPEMGRWFEKLSELGVTFVRLHMLESENKDVKSKYGLTTEENVKALLFFDALEKRIAPLKFDLFSEMQSLMLGRDDSTSCIWNACDPYTTSAVQGVEGHGQKSNCGRTNKDGIDFVKADVEGFERYIALYHTPQEHGGCKDCRFFLMCKGQCPGTSQENDWRNRTEHCGVWKELYKHLEDRMLDGREIPLSASPERGRLEEEFLRTWRVGRNININMALNSIRRNAGGPAPVAVPAGNGALATGHGDVPHGDLPHGDGFNN